MTGYQEILTDPSYKGQIVTMTYPMMGNYGVNFEDIESVGIQAEGFIVKEYHRQPSNWRAKGDLAEYLKAAGKLGVEGFDTRGHHQRLRQAGAMRGIISTLDLDPERLVRRVKEEVPDMNGLDLVPWSPAAPPTGGTNLLRGRAGPPRFPGPPPPPFREHWRPAGGPWKTCKPCGLSVPAKKSFSTTTASSTTSSGP